MKHLSYQSEHRLATDALHFCLFVFCVSVSCIGCSGDEVYYGGPIMIGIVSISEERPAEVRFGVVGLIEGCGPIPFENVYADRVENTIYLKPTVLENYNTGGGYICSAIDQIYGEVSVKDFDVGEYKIVSNDYEYFRLRIEKATASVLRKPIIRDITVEIKTSEGLEVFETLFSEPLIKTAEPVAVRISVRGYFEYGCEVEDPSKVKADIKRESGAIDVNISSEVSIADCIRDITGILDTSSGYDAQIDLGTLGAGEYRLNVNGHEVQFSIRIGVGNVPAG